MGWFNKKKGVRPPVGMKAPETVRNTEDAKKVLFAIKTHAIAQATAILVACEHRLADDETLLQWCKEYQKERLERLGCYQFLRSTDAALVAVEKAMDLVNVRVAESNVAKAKEGLKQAKAAVAGA